MSTPLAGQTIWLTRAVHQSAAWARLLEQAGATVIVEPLMAIEPTADRHAAYRALMQAVTADRVLVTSTNAVDAAWQLMPGFAPAGRLYGVGNASAQALEAAAGRPVERPAGAFTSEGLLAMDTLTRVEGLDIAILSGEGGRDLLVDTLSQRGARVHKIALYRRCWLTPSVDRLERIAHRADAVIVTSGEALAHLCDLVNKRAYVDVRAALERCRLVAPSVRVVKQADQRLNWQHAPLIVERISGEAIVAALARQSTGDRQ
ncbi:uroporphyrinogen III synthase HEM4 [Salinisphaera sp. C84B14]|uniref:uroporphyrinogen-III synthase n=1 Tax=Salinisphaera sp. C84B14 TaxID=1304155 RepID=UPI00333EB563